MKTQLMSISILLFLSLTLAIPVIGTSPNVTSETIIYENEISQTFTSTNILVDESHCDGASEMWTPGNASAFGWILMEHGYNVSNNFDESLDSGILDDYGILCLFFPMVELTTGEIDAVQSFVAAGGGLLLVGVNYESTNWAYTPANLNPISQAYGITFELDKWLQTSKSSDGDFVAHNITADVTSIHSNGDDIEGCHLTVTSPAETLAYHSDDSVVAIAENGSGRVVAVGAAAPFLMYRGTTDWQVSPNDHFQFTLNVIDWLAGNDQREVEPPEKMIIRLGSDSDLSPSEIEEYELFTGVYHDHTTASDGADTPTVMALRAVEISLDWFIVTDHSYDRAAFNGIYGGLAVQAFGEANNLATQFIVGAELSSHPHTVGFPLTEQIISSDVQYSVDEIHAQGAYAVFAHPTIGFTYATVWENFDSFGYDAFEVMNDRYFHALGESAYYRNYIGGNDGHSAEDLGMTSNTVFVKNPTGPNGAVSAADIIDAIENRRIVVTSRYNGLIFGEDVWVDRYLAVWEEAEDAIEDAETQIAVSAGEGNNVDLANRFVAEANNALDWWNPSNALQAATDAVSEVVLGINIELTTENIGIIEPNGAVSFAMQLENNLNHGVCVNITPILATSLTLDESTQLLVVGPESTEEVDWSGTAKEKGYNHIMFYLRNLNSTPMAIPLIFHYGGIIGNVSHTIEQVDTGYNVIVRLYEQRGDGIYTASITMDYDDGTNQETVALTDVGDGYAVTIGPFALGINVTYQITMDDIYGNTFVFDEEVVTISEDGLIIDPVLIIVLGLIGIVAIVVIVFVMRKR